MPLIRLTILLVFFLGLFGSAQEASSTPLLALREAQNCGGCHNPGRGQKPFLERRCTLDCQGCHVDPSGGAARNQWGYYYSIDQLPTLSPYKPIDPLKDESRFDLHVDARMMQWKRPDGNTETFPMAVESSIRVRPFIRYLHLTYSALALGRIGDPSLRIVKEGSRRYRERYAVMVDNLPMNIYLRAYRGTPMYGLKRPNHSLWIRERLGLDQFATTDAVEMGGTPNVPFLRASHMLGDPYADKSVRQRGTSYHGGMRGVSFGWHVNTSGWSTRSDFHKVDMQAAGAGFSLFKFTLYGERNWRTVTALGDTSPSTPLFLHPSSEISEYTLAFQGIPGLSFGVVQEELKTLDQEGRRKNLFIDLHPIPWIQLEFWRRSETGARSLEDSLGLLHFYADF